MEWAVLSLYTHIGSSNLAVLDILNDNASRYLQRVSRLSFSLCFLFVMNSSFSDIPGHIPDAFRARFAMDLLH
jgi:hypothetical protein